MRKLKLDLDQLTVATFETSEEADHRGTVLGNKTPIPSEQSCDDFCTYTWDGYDTCAHSWCAQSCHNGCGTLQTNECGGCQVG
ncbi:MAG TPA: hypothetical protein VGB24_22900 [Longimicrobium sp.]|uniref:hypothetical protein n=1 Tax=Longimicrobium sp. TaxID=2029185 RepID=UPI002ED92B4A